MFLTPSVLLSSTGTPLTKELTNLLSDEGRVPANGAFLLVGINDLTLINESSRSTFGGDGHEAFESFTGEERALTERLTTEITEIAAVSDIKEIIKFVSALPDAGYTSFRSLR